MTSSLFTLLFSAWLFTAALMAFLWLLQRARQDASHVDVAWAASVGLLACFYAVMAEGDASRRLLLAVLAVSWAFRLTRYLFVNRVWGKPEDGRYRNLRQHWKENAQPYFFIFFQAQAVLAVIFSIPFLVIAADSTPTFTGWDGMGLGVWITAIIGESSADRQLARFRSDARNHGKTCRIGLWRYSRHPNYFFEWLHWWTYVLLGLGSPSWWLTLIGPLLMLYLLFKVTEIPATETQAVTSRGEDYRAYQRTTNAFIPWFPKTEHM